MDLDFDQLDLVKVQIAAKYLTGPYGAVNGGGVQGDGQTSVGYDASSGEVWFDAPAGTDLTSINIESPAASLRAVPTKSGRQL